MNVADPVPFLFSAGGVSALAAAINASESYRRAARRWDWPVVFAREDGDNFVDGMFLDLRRGTCANARLAVKDDFTTAPFVITASSEQWNDILTGGSDPITQLMRGHLRLQRGSLARLARYIRAARALVDCARDTVGMTSDLTPAQSTKTLGTSSESLDKHRASELGSTVPLLLFEKAKRLGIWNPADVDLSQDATDWQQLAVLEREVLLHLTALFFAGEEAVLHDILPLVLTISREHRIDEELYLSTFVFEEAKHTDFFDRWMAQVVGDTGDLSRFHGPSYEKLFLQELPSAMNNLLEDSSPQAQIRAAVTYNMIVEGTLAETGYHAFYTILAEAEIMPGMQTGIRHLQNDESRHIRYGLYLIDRLTSAHPHLLQAVTEGMDSLLELVLGVIQELFDTYDEMPFGLRIETFVDYAMRQFSKRMNKLQGQR